MGAPAFQALLVHQIIRVRPATSTDDYNETVYDYGAGAARSDLIDALLQQDNRLEQFPDGRAVNDQRWQLFTEEADVVSTDRIEWPARGLTFRVEGEPEPVFDVPAGPFHHLEASLRIVAG